LIGSDKTVKNIGISFQYKTPICNQDRRENMHKAIRQNKIKNIKWESIIIIIIIVIIIIITAIGLSPGGSGYWLLLNLSLEGYMRSM
jgi:t-SNARE complex subunit (syntaxin)